jgi:hypothetical protein
LPCKWGSVSFRSLGVGELEIQMAREPTRVAHLHFRYT